MAKLDGSFRLFIVTAPYSTGSFVADTVDMLKLLPKKKLWHYLPEVKELDVKAGKTSRVTKGEITRMAKNQKDELSKADFDYIMLNWK